MSNYPVERLDDGRVLVHDIRTVALRGNGHECGLTIDSMEEARALAHAILDADRHPSEALPLTRVEIIDVGEHARRLYGKEGADRITAIFGRPAPEHDYRFHTNHDQHTGSLWTAGSDATAADVMTLFMRDLELKAKGL